MPSSDRADQLSRRAKGDPGRSKRTHALAGTGPQRAGCSSPKHLCSGRPAALRLDRGYRAVGLLVVRPPDCDPCGLQNEGAADEDGREPLRIGLVRIGPVRIGDAGLGEQHDGGTKKVRNSQ